MCITEKQNSCQLVVDAKHPYGYGRAPFFWCLVSALGMFWVGGGIAIYHGISSLINPLHLDVTTYHVWVVLAGAFFIDGYVLYVSCGAPTHTHLVYRL